MICAAQATHDRAIIFVRLDQRPFCTEHATSGIVVVLVLIHTGRLALDQRTVGAFENAGFFGGDFELIVTAVAAVAINHDVVGVSREDVQQMNPRAVGVAWRVEVCVVVARERSARSVVVFIHVDFCVIQRPAEIDRDRLITPRRVGVDNVARSRSGVGTHLVVVVVEAAGVVEARKREVFDHPGLFNGVTLDPATVVVNARGGRILHVVILKWSRGTRDRAQKYGNGQQSYNLHHNNLRWARAEAHVRLSCDCDIHPISPDDLPSRSPLLRERVDPPAIKRALSCWGNCTREGRERTSASCGERRGMLGE